MIKRCDCENITHKTRCTKPVRWQCGQCGMLLCEECAHRHHAHTQMERYTPPTTPPPSHPGAADVIGERTTIAAGPYVGWSGQVLEAGSEEGWVVVRFDGGAGDIEVPLNICGVEYQ